LVDARECARVCRIFLLLRNIPFSADVSGSKLPRDAAHVQCRSILMKINKLLAASSIAAFALVSAAVAQEKSTAPARETTATEKMDLKGSWRSTKLIGLDIYNRADEKLGDINEILLDKDGKVKGVVIGVGGFLGMGEHDIAVSMDKLKFMEEPHKTAARADTRSDAKTDAKTDNRTTTGAATAPARRETATDWVPDHAVMDATKDQLKAMPQFKYSSYN
jgi:hypothetical protein